MFLMMENSLNGLVQEILSLLASFGPLREAQILSYIAWKYGVNGASDPSKYEALRKAIERRLKRLSKWGYVKRESREYAITQDGYYFLVATKISQIKDIEDLLWDYFDRYFEFEAEPDIYVENTPEGLLRFLADALSFYASELDALRAIYLDRDSPVRKRLYLGSDGVIYAFTGRSGLELTLRYCGPGPPPEDRPRVIKLKYDEVPQVDKRCYWRLINELEEILEEWKALTFIRDLFVVDGLDMLVMEVIDELERSLIDLERWSFLFYWLYYTDALDGPFLDPFIENLSIELDDLNERLKNLALSIEEFAIKIREKLDGRKNSPGSFTSVAWP